MRRLPPYVVRLGGVVLIASGLHPFFHWSPVLPGLPNGLLAHRRETPSNRLWGFLDANADLFALLAAGLAVVGVNVPVASRRRRPSEAEAARNGPTLTGWGR